MPVGQDKAGILGRIAMSHCFARNHCILLMVFGLGLGLPGARGEPEKNRPPSLNLLSMEVAALQTLHEFRFTDDQLVALRKVAKETASEVGARQAGKASKEFQDTLAELREALIDGLDSERIDELQEQLDSLHESEQPELDDEVEVTEAARQRAPEIFRLLRARQVAVYVAIHDEEFDDPYTRVVETLGMARGLGDKEWKVLRESIAEEVGWMTAGLNTDKATRTGEQVVQLLIQARTLKDEEFKKQRPELEKMARKIIGDIGPLEVMRHGVEKALAELLSNPRLSAALDARLPK
jgi:hypothetical protein